MNFLFNIDFKTVFGEELVLNVIMAGKTAHYRMTTSTAFAGAMD